MFLLLNFITKGKKMLYIYNFKLKKRKKNRIKIKKWSEQDSNCRVCSHESKKF